MRPSFRSLALALALVLSGSTSFASSFLLLGVEANCNGSKPANDLSWAASDPPPYTILRSQLPSGPEIEIASTNTLNYRDTTPVPGAVYAYVVSSKDAAGVTTRSTGRVADTQLCTHLPGPTVLTATEICNLGVTPHRAGVHLSWTAAVNAEYYDVYRDSGTFLVASQVHGLSADDLSLLTIGRNYNDYIVRVGTSQNGSNYSNTASVTISNNACPPPPEAFTLSGSSVCDVSTNTPFPTVRLTWTPSLNATIYQVLRDGALYVTQSSTAFADSNVLSGSSHGYQVRAINNSGSIDSNVITVAVAADLCHVPPGPFALVSPMWTLCAGGDQPSAVPQWSASKFASSYSVYRDGVRIVTLTPSELGREDSPLVAGKTYQYLIRATNDYGSTDASAAVTIPATICVPPAPSYVSVAGYCEQGAPLVHVSWPPVRYVTTYEVFRDGTAISPRLTGTASTYDDHTASAGKSYVYFVRGSNASGASDSPMSSVALAGDLCPVPAQTFPITAHTACTTAPEVTLDWTPVALVSSYSVYRNGVFLAILGTSAHTFTDTTAAAGQPYTYFVRGSSDSAAYESNSIVVTVAACPAAPVVSPRRRSSHP